MTNKLTTKAAKTFFALAHRNAWGRASTLKYCARNGISGLFRLAQQLEAAK